MRLEFGYGKNVETVDVPDNNLLKVLRSNDMVHQRRGRDAVEFALDNPIGSGRLEDIVSCEGKVTIVTSDISRPMPTAEVLPPVLERLYRAGVPKENITVVLALGVHRNHTDDEKKRLVGEKAMSEVRVADSNESGYVRLGTTSMGTPVDICRDVAEADYLICLGNIEFHYFAGYSGGYKAIMPGCSTADAIQANHRNMVSEHAAAGVIEGNPVRSDIEDAGRICGVDFIVNVVLDEHRKIVYAVAGDPIQAHRKGCLYLDRMYRCPIPRKADIVIVSQGGYPKDANLYQTQKALDNAKYAVRDGGSIILIGACNEGFGSAAFEQWLTASETSSSMIERIERDFQLGGHKAAAIAMVLEKADIYLVSEMDAELVRSVFLKPASSAQEALDICMKKYGEDASVIAMPYGGSTLPSLM